MKWTMKRKLKIARYDKYKYSGRPIRRRPKRGSTQSIRWANWIFLNARFKLINKTFDSKLISPSLLGFSSHGDYWPLFPSLVLSLLVTDSRDKCLPCLPTCNSIFPRVWSAWDFVSRYLWRKRRHIILEPFDTSSQRSALNGRLNLHSNSTTYLNQSPSFEDDINVCGFWTIQNFIICDVWSQFILRMDLMCNC